MLFHKKRPQIEGDFTAGSSAAGDDGASASEAVKAFDQDIAANVFDDEIHAAAIGDFADFGWPMGIRGVEDEFRAEMLREHAFGLGRAGANDARAELLGDLDGSGANAAGAPDNQNPIACVDSRAIGEHVHGGAAGEGQGRGSVEIQSWGKADKAAGGDENFFGESAVAIHAEQLAKETERFIAALTKFTLAAKEIGLDGDFIAGFPVFDSVPHSNDPPGNFTTESAGQLNWNGQASRFCPEIDMIKAAALNLDDGFIGSGDRIRNIAQFEFSRGAVGDEL